ncbi:hypothetical protein A3C98_04340 [Candidatus Roizmanbacteria bacterium RIFCSPHIGHO2_02_FULL_37_15]|uniref:Uncharacterized protein n=1 Tax=Candidatus Roizmanbacteria bacterium RIFCSPLOWO2_01_FULL_37_16 TaxID=1802058 RepID=A0A1F7IIS1_9BACT|nr:MAG: hypothetical protein A2859_01070 [Candidatus Roizmanbacteria bacterium RIFCSPHIGHO2_01_FULL_37_16b]OGK20721.1 MAG: hypothetical protein A3C98_04340 [Candidatus Roizmanbacteria bacterium RIFCSPHIGHO2_02_FULL_37_15]OGK33312.1 MAG: hypothetical protein A3F57_05220 [Candidatus Roizmanbacteria bacterium RIFCSPHIGHO2_12_FULL_36_11]OGK43224.1 MAG: hypothetical protein A3B40_03095 [Candidatus Roizmanbacteria bacterium RIFCSPLOWO2_01_FULL_37_16]
MEKTSFIKKLYNVTTKDYTYTIAFFFIFSFFIFYVIKPNLLSVFETNAKIKQLEKTNILYERQIDKIIEIQSVFERNREDFLILDEAIGSKPEVNKLLSDVAISSGESTLAVERIDIFDINLKEKVKEEKLKSFVINMDLTGTFEDTVFYIKKIYGQRRLKLIPDLELVKDRIETSPSASLKIKLKVEGYHL